MKIIFVGIHNKTGKKPLCSTTKSGKLIDRIIKDIQPIDTLKTNLYNLEYLPEINDRAENARFWWNRVQPCPDDLIVLLGQHVSKFFFYDNKGHSPALIPHPASAMGTDAMNEYVYKAVELIQSITSPGDGAQNQQ